LQAGAVFFQEGTLCDDKACAQAGSSYFDAVAVSKSDMKSDLLPGFAAIALALLVFALAAAGCSHRASDTLVVGMELSYPPFEMTDENGNPAGVSVDLARDLGKFLGKKVVIENTSFDGLIPSLKSGRIDLILSSMTATPERGLSVDFSDSYLKTGLCLLVSAKSGIQSIEEADQPGKSIAVKKGTTGQTYAAEHLKKAQVLVLDKESACVLEVTQGRTDAFIYDQMSVFKNWQRNPETTRALLVPFRGESWAVAVRKGNAGLLKQVNAFIAEYRAQGGFEKLGDRWLPEQKAAFRKLGYPFYF
jgi:polar amino acid transport system substrate-binding protein